MNNEDRIFPIIRQFYNKIIDNDLEKDKSGVLIVEIILCNLKLIPSQPILNFRNVKKTNTSYCLKELDWYISQSLSIINYVDDIQIWNMICTKDSKKEVNSNYGWCIFSENNFNQYNFVLNELKFNKFSRRACMIYNRPSITEDYKRNGMQDYICTNYVQCFIRNNKLIYNVHQRSCDFIYGFFNDFYWHCFVYNKLIEDLSSENYKNLEIGDINYICDSLHVYEKHFSLIKNICNNFNK